MNKELLERVIKICQNVSSLLDSVIFEIHEKIDQNDVNKILIQIDRLILDCKEELEKLK